MGSKEIPSGYLTKEGNYLRVGSLVGRRMYKITCDTCCLDLELFPAYFTLRVDHIISGIVPCGCSSTYRWSEEQYIIRVNRLCKERDYTLLGWEGVYRKSRTKLILLNNLTGNTWRTTTIASLLKGSGDPAEKGNAISDGKKEDLSNHITKILTVLPNIEEGSITRSDKRTPSGRKSSLNYKCSICSYDQYVKAGLCSGVFTTLMNELKLGTLSCRCTKTYRWRKVEKEFQLTETLTPKGYKFLGWDGEYKGSRSKVFVMCDKGHVQTSNLPNVLKGHGCLTCHLLSENSYGYYKDKVDVLDTLYVLNFKGGCIKVGRSFDLNVRLKALSKDSGVSVEDISVVTLYTGRHDDVYRAEQEIHIKLKELGYYIKDCTWSCETFKVDCKRDLNVILQGLKGLTQER